MKFEISKKHFFDALNRMKEVCTKGLRSEFDLAHRVTINVTTSGVQFYSSNGHLDARWEVTPITDTKFKCVEPGTITIDASVSHGIIAAIGGQVQDILLECELDKEMLLCKDISSKNKKKVKIQTLTDHHKISIKKPKSGFSFTLSNEDFKSGVNLVGAFADMEYKVKYQMICLHFLKDETRFICGNGLRFVIFSSKLSTPNAAVTDNDGHKFLLPKDQAAIIGRVCDGAENIEFIYENEQTCYIKPTNAMEMVLHGIPNEKYIPYERFAFCTDQARLIVDVPSVEFRECIAIASSVKDNEKIVQGVFHHAKFSVNGKKALDLVVDEQKYQCELECSADIYHVQGEPNFKSMYAVAHLKDLSVLAKKPMIRFYCVDEKKTLVAELIETDDNNKLNNIPQAKDGTHDNRVSIFFSAIVEDENE